ncbi:flavodoxin family protein [Christensenella minuta]|uniref:flavodoxin family protein n=1 Tax=Christensenella minuta TaxID=626937 RepID=UPI002A7FC9DB|nr:flavodoxin domain-containing protein [Christensenella minuta]MDY3751653.1 flavodoxin domain-containing protein [Christensenella minuta]
MVEVRYFSKSGNTKAVADVIAAEAGVKVGSVEGADAVRADILFLGGALYAGGIAGKLKKFIKTLSPEHVGCVAVFSTTANPNGAYAKIKKALDKQGLRVLEHEFHCTGGQAKSGEAARHAAVFANEVLEETRRG